MMSQLVIRLGRIVRAALIVAGALFAIAIVWFLTRLPLVIDAPLNVTTSPTSADAIVCIGAGTTSHDLPTEDGWQRIYTSVALFADGYAPEVVFTGRGNAKVSEAEIYADAARWLGLPPEAIRLDPLPASTAEHPDSLLTTPDARIRLDSRLLLVASTLHSRRVLMTFRKRGYTHISVVGDHTPAVRPPASGRRGTTALVTFRRDNKHYDGVLFKLRLRSNRLLTALREWAAIAVYKQKGLA